MDGFPVSSDGREPALRRGRGAAWNPPSRFETVGFEPVPDVGPSGTAASTAAATTVLADRTRSVINPVESPDLGFRWTVNPYRGCEHGCVYCYARPGHEYLGLSSGLDFETRIFAKHDAPALLRRELSRGSWLGEPIVFSGVTDPYQPVEQRLGIGRGCLEVFADFRQPVGIVTKSRLVLRDIDLLQKLAAHAAVSVAVSLTSLDAVLSGRMEPRAAAPADRLIAIRRLRAAGVPVGVMVAPVIPGLNDVEVPALVEAAAEAGAGWAATVLLRLPYQLKSLFGRWLRDRFPGRAAHVESLLRQMHGGRLYEGRFGRRMRGVGPLADHQRRLFEACVRRQGLEARPPRLSSRSFRRPPDPQMTLF